MQEERENREEGWKKKNETIFLTAHSDPAFKQWVSDKW
jgi:hypothetical protein